MGEDYQADRGDGPSQRHELRRLISNSYALLRSIIHRSAESATGLDAYVLHLEGRLDAIGRVLLAAVLDPGIRFDLGRLIEDELDDQRADGRQHSWVVDGPPVAIDAAAAEVLALVFHELVTNSVEHGVLGMEEGGALQVGWRIEAAEGGDVLMLDWTERGAPAVMARTGFGTVVLDGMLRYQLDGTARQGFDAAGVTTSLSIPLSRLTATDD